MFLVAKLGSTSRLARAGALAINVFLGSTSGMRSTEIFPLELAVVGASASGSIGTVTVSEIDGMATGDGAAAGSIGTETDSAITGLATGAAAAIGALATVTVSEIDGVATGGASTSDPIGTETDSAITGLAAGGGAASGSLGTVTISEIDGTASATHGGAATGPIGTETDSAILGGATGDAAGGGSLSSLSISPLSGSAHVDVFPSGDLGTVTTFEIDGDAIGAADAPETLPTVDASAINATVFILSAVVVQIPASRLRSRLEYASLQLAEYFVQIKLPAVISVGWNQRAQQINQGTGRANRVVFDDADGKSGKLTAATQPGGNPRPLYNWERAIRISVWAYDGSKPEDTSRQLWAAETLLESVLQGLHRSSYGQFHPGEVDRAPKGNERVFGCEFVLSGDLHSPMFDRAYGVVRPMNVAVKKNLDGGGS